MKKVAICGRVVNFDCSAWLLASLSSQQLGIKVVGNKEGNGESGEGNSDGNKGGRQATVTSQAMVMAARVVGNKEGDCKGGKGGGQ
jgi:hypothetical protein